MENLILSDKLDSLQRCLVRIEERRAGTLEALLADRDRQDILSLNLTRAVQLCVDMALHVLGAGDEPVPHTMSGAFERLAARGFISAEVSRRMRAAVGFRNVAVHSYREIDWRVVQAITHEHLDDFRAFGTAIAGLIDSP